MIFLNRSACREEDTPKFSQSGSPKDFARVNKFSIRASDDNKSTGECCTLIHSSRVQCQQRRYDDQRDDGCIEASETKVSCHQRGSESSMSSAHHVSYLAASGGDSKAVHHVSGSDWRRLDAIMDCGSAECGALEDIAKSIPLVETEASRQGQTYHPAEGGVIKNNGGKDCDDVLGDW